MAKLLKADWSMKRVCFLKRAKLLAHDWSSGCLATAYSIKKLFFCKNAWRLVSRQLTRKISKN